MLVAESHLKVAVQIIVSIRAWQNSTTAIDQGKAKTEDAFSRRFIRAQLVDIEVALQLTRTETTARHGLDQTERYHQVRISPNTPQCSLPVPWLWRQNSSPPPGQKLLYGMAWTGWNVITR